MYESRNENELPVLVTYFNKNDITPTIATYLDVILYSREQIIEEYKAMNQLPPQSDCLWSIISIKAQTVNYELPMQPITMMRNALGKSEGGSGVALNKELYMKSVEFWKKYATVK